LKCINNRYIFFELMSRRSIHQHPSQRQLNPAGWVWPNAVRWPLSKKNTKKNLAKSKTRKGGLSQKWLSRWTENLKRAVQAKIRDIQKRIYSRWIENPKGRSRQKLWIWKKLMKKMKKWKRQRHHISNGPNRRIYLVLVYKWRLLPFWLIDGFYPEKWWMVSVLWLMATSVCGLINGVSCMWFD